MKILYIVPGLDEGGAEVHVLNLIRELSERGHDITLASCGGRLEAELPENVRVIHVPSERKNPVTIIHSARVLSRLGRWEIIHAHSRVPAWAAWVLSGLTRTPWLMTAHALYSLNAGLIPLRRADGLICVSEAVKNHLASYLPAKCTVIPNGIIPPVFRHKDSIANRLLFVGRLTRLKGLDVVLRALAGLAGREWTLDVVGDGPQRVELEELSEGLGLSERVTFQGARSRGEVEEFMAFASCLLFPSHSEGMGLVVLEAASMGLPVIASDLEALREIASGGLIPAGDVEAWRGAIIGFLDSGTASTLNPAKIITVHEMACRIEKFYSVILEQQRH